MSEKKCKTCRWWTGEQPDWTDEPYTGHCERIHASGNDRVDETAARLYPVGANAWLDTSSNFGCTMHEAKRKKERA